MVAGISMAGIIVKRNAEREQGGCQGPRVKKGAIKGNECVVG
jgi:hypothetical protein